MTISRMQRFWLVIFEHFHAHADQKSHGGHHSFREQGCDPCGYGTLLRGARQSAATSFLFRGRGKSPAQFRMEMIGTVANGRYGRKTEGGYHWKWVN